MRVEAAHRDLRHLEAEVVGDELRDQCVLALAFEREADTHSHVAQHVEGNGRAFRLSDPRHAHDRVGVRVHHTGLDDRNDPDPHRPSPLAGLLLLFAQLVIAGERKRLVEHDFVLSAVVFVAAGDRVGKLIRGDEVLAAELCGVDAELARRHVDETFEHEEVRRRPHAAVGMRGNLVGGDQREVVFRGADRVRAGEGREHLGGADRSVALAIGPDVVDELHPESGERAIGLDRELRFVVPVPSLSRAGCQVLDAIFDPFDRLCHRPCAKGGR